MGIIRPATPGFLVTLVATILLAVVSFSVPWVKSVYFLKASLEVSNINGSITFGTLGYCTTLSNGTTCSSPSVGYEYDINALVGDNTSIQIPQVVVKWVTYALVLHIVALVLAAGSAVFGLLAHVREFSMTCCSTCISGFAAVIALLAFVFDIAFFFLAKSRINSVDGGSASMGNGIWLTLAAWVLLFFSGCFYGIGKCCIRRNPRHPYSKSTDEDQRWKGNNAAMPGGYEEQMRLDAVKAEADRKARQKQGEIGLPAFQEYDPTQPLTTAHEDEEHSLSYHDTHPGATAVGAGAAAGAYTARNEGHYANGYAPAPTNTRAVDEYYSPSNQTSNNAYPPQPRRQGSQATTAYSASNYGYAGAGTGAASGAAAATHDYLNTNPSYGHQQYPTQATGQYPTAHDQYPSQVIYGHAVESSANSTYPSNAYADPYAASRSPPVPDAYNQTNYYNTAPYTQTTTPPALGPPSGHSAATAAAAAALGVGAGSGSGANSYYTPGTTTSPPPATQPRSYTLGGGGYGDNVVPELPSGSSLYGGGAAAASGSSSRAPQINTAVPGASSYTSPTRGPAGPRQQMVLHGSPTNEYEDSPPVYDEGLAQPAGQWNSKR